MALRTCPKEDHPRLSTSKGRCKPEIDPIEAERNKYGNRQVTSQSAQLAQDYLYPNATRNEWDLYSMALTTPNTYEVWWYSRLYPR